MAGKSNGITTSPHRKEYERLLKAGWTAPTLSRFAAHRYGEKISPEAIRKYRSRHRIDPPKQSWGTAPDDTVDVFGTRASLIRLQLSRIAIDAEHERNMKKLFASTRAEIDTLNRLIESHKQDLQDMGMLPKTPEDVQITHKQAQDAPKAASLAEVFDTDELAAQDLAKVIHLRVAGNGEPRGV